MPGPRILHHLKKFLGQMQTGYSMTLLFSAEAPNILTICAGPTGTLYSAPLAHSPAPVCVRDTQKFIEPCRRQIHGGTQWGWLWVGSGDPKWPRWPFPLGSPSRAEGKQAILPLARLSQIRGLQKSYLGSETCSLWSLKAVGTSPSIMFEKSK